MADIKIDKEGNWYYRGAEMFRKDIVKYFYEHLKMDDEGRYVIEIPGDSCFVEVEDTAFVVKSVDFTDRGIILHISDGSIEKLDPATLYLGEGNVMYCKIKNGSFPARFNRASYYQLAAHISHDEKSGAFYLTIGDKRFCVAAS